MITHVKYMLAAGLTLPAIRDNTELLTSSSAFGRALTSEDS